MKPTKLQTSDDQYRKLEEAHDRLRAGSKTVRVDAEALQAIIRDHSALITRFRSDVELPR